ncbi:MAG: hypothetical protein F9K32_03245 [Desulfobulbaceae bacterium]|nr:MAG: hypothetical protein F9K32_03245 [Desulfobulbaceae bacterium]
MKIAESAVFFASQHSYQETYKKSESLTVWDNRPNGEIPGLNRFKRLPESKGAGHINSASRVDLSDTGRRVRHHRGEITPLSKDERDIADLNLRIFAMLVERLTGRKIDVTVPTEAVSAEGDVAAAQNPEAAAQESVQGELQGFGMAYDYHESYSEKEAMSFSASGVIRTEDGREIDFSAQLNMSRQFMVEKSVSIRAGDALKDPLVVNFSGAAAELGERNFVFDIDSDGTSDQISFVGPQSGFLALDRNGDGAINNGSELFGPSTGSGFAELAAFDLDGNGWIDENDDIYDRLRVWTQTADGRQQLFALGEKGVGAIYLNHLATPFSIKDDGNELLGKVRDSSIFLGDDGSVGTIQQIDLAV